MCQYTWGIPLTFCFEPPSPTTTQTGKQFVSVKNDQNEVWLLLYWLGLSVTLLSFYIQAQSKHRQTENNQVPNKKHAVTFPRLVYVIPKQRRLIENMCSASSISAAACILCVFQHLTVKCFAMKISRTSDHSHSLVWCWLKLYMSGLGKLSWKKW